jgi:hypothetical protein
VEQLSPGEEHHGYSIDTEHPRSNPLESDAALSVPLLMCGHFA